MSFVRLNKVTKRYSNLLVLREASFRVGDGERVGLVGKNGAGKSTVLRLILGQDNPDEGTVDSSLDVKLGYFSQFSDLHGASSIQTVLESLFADIHLLADELDRLGTMLEAVTDAAEMETCLERQAYLLEEMDRRQGWDYQRHIDTVLTRLGFNGVRRAQPIDELSGGWRNRASLAKILLESPDILLLDEPTNFLDVEGLAWLEEWLKGFRGGLLLVSHDRQFLDAVVTRVVEIENHQFQDYPGNYTEFVRAKPFRLKTLQRQFEHEEELLTIDAEAASDRAELMRDPSDRMRRKLADIKKRRPPRPIDTIITDVYDNLRVPDNILAVEGISKSYGDQKLFHDISFQVQNGERIGIVGPNGSGKSTLLKVLTQSVKPDKGRVNWERGVEFADFNACFADLDLEDTLTHAVNIHGLAYHATRKEVNRFLGLLQFTEMDLSQKIGTLSGGQRARVALAKCLLSGAAMLILDEPTNHLDLTSIRVMEQALIHFPGSIIVVSHDRFFLDKVATKLLVFDGIAVKSFSGNWSMWAAT